MLMRLYIYRTKNIVIQVNKQCIIFDKRGMSFVNRGTGVLIKRHNLTAKGIVMVR